MNYICRSYERRTDLLLCFFNLRMAFTIVWTLLYGVNQYSMIFLPQTKFLGLFHYRKAVNFLGVPVR
jgi:hypothetical protein